MYSTILLLLICSFYLLYHLSARMKVAACLAISKYLQQQPSLSRIVSLTLMMLAAVLSICHLGIGSGIFSFILVFMSAGCLVVAIAPFRYISMIHLLAIYLLSISLELFVF